MRKYLVTLLVAAVVAGVGGYLDWASAPPTRIVSEARLGEALAGERAWAEELGIRRPEVEDLGVSTSHWHRELPLASGQCVALIAGLRGEVGADTLRAVEVREGETLLASSPDEEAWTAATQTQWCAGTEEEIVTLHVRTGRIASVRLRRPWFTPRVYVRVLLSPPDHGLSVRELTRTRLGPTVMDELRAERVRTVLAGRPPLGEAIRPELTVNFEAGARLLPESEATWLALSRAASRRSLQPSHPRVDRSRPAGWVPLVPPVEDPEAELPSRPVAHDPWIEAAYAGDGQPVADGEEQLLRVLAVVDHGALGVPCVRIRFSRRAVLHRAPAVRRISVPAWEGRILTRDGLLSVDHACPAEGLFVYAVPASDQADYGVELFAAEAPEGTAARPSTYRGGGLPAPAAIVAAEARCEGREAATPPATSSDGSPATSGQSRASACVEHGRFLEASRLAERDLELVRARYRSACELGSAEGCLRQALVDRPERPDVRLVRRACEGGYALGCAHLGDALRLGRGIAADYPAARLAYAQACNGGTQRGCTNVAIMDRYDLGGGEP